MNKEPEALHILQVAQLPPPSSQHPAWLIENLWAHQAVGVIGGAPKCCLCRARHKQHYAASRIMPPGGSC